MLVSATAPRKDLAVVSGRHVRKRALSQKTSGRLGLPTLISNKYDIVFCVARLLGPFDCVVAGNIQSLACCDFPFREFVNLVRNSIELGEVWWTSRRVLACLRPTSIARLRSHCPERVIREKGNVVALYAGRPDLRTRVATFFNNAIRARE
jgi:hypothetical protein